MDRTLVDRRLSKPGAFACFLSGLQPPKELKKQSFAALYNTIIVADTCPKSGSMLEGVGHARGSAVQTSTLVLMTVGFRLG